MNNLIEGSWEAEENSRKKPKVFGSLQEAFRYSQLKSQRVWEPGCTRYGRKEGIFYGRGKTMKLLTAVIVEFQVSEKA